VPLYLTEADVAALLTPEDAIAAVADCFARLASGEIDNRPRARQKVDGGVFAVMSAVDHGQHLAGVKSYAWVPDGTPFVVCLFDLRVGELVAVIEADKLGQLRTGAASAVAATYLARDDELSLGVLGCGWQAESQVQCIREAVAIKRVVAYCRTEENLARFCRKVGAEAGETHRDAGEQDIVVTVTTSRDPVLRGEWLKPGALVCAVGANDRRARELDNAVLERASFICCDSVEQAKLESGDLIEPVEQGILDWLEVHELQKVVGGEIQGRQSPDDIVLFKSNGLAAWDVAIGRRALGLARERGVGVEL
jgi:ornithine cyclodeaminase/alanine dehydrogenase-like protein (mu-crystallin family)